MLLKTVYKALIYTRFLVHKIFSSVVWIKERELHFATTSRSPAPFPTLATISRDRNGEKTLEQPYKEGSWYQLQNPLQGKQLFIEYQEQWIKRWKRWSEVISQEAEVCFWSFVYVPKLLLFQIAVSTLECFLSRIF